MLGVHLTRRMPNKPFFGIRSSLPQFRMPCSRLHADVDIPSTSHKNHFIIPTLTARKHYFSRCINTNELDWYHNLNINRYNYKAGNTSEHMACRALCIGVYCTLCHSKQAQHASCTVYPVPPATGPSNCAKVERAVRLKLIWVHLFFLFFRFREGNKQIRKKKTYFILPKIWFIPQYSAAQSQKRKITRIVQSPSRSHIWNSWIAKFKNIKTDNLRSHYIQ